MKILLTGAEGQVGQAVIEAAKNLPHIDLIVCNHQMLDIADYQSVKKNIEKYLPHILINCAAYTAVDHAELITERKRVQRVNIAGPENLAKICAQKNIFLFHLSTDYVFDGLKSSAYLETDIVNPINYYGMSKLLGEQMILKYAQKYIILRVSWIFSQYGNNPLKNLIKLMQNREELNMIADQKTCPTYAKDIAEVFLDLAERKDLELKSGLYHYCNMPEISRYDLTVFIHQIASKITMLKTVQINPITIAQFPTPALRPKNSVLNCELFLKTFERKLNIWQDNLEKSIEEIICATSR